jgi:hypothetical protein
VSFILIDTKEPYMQSVIQLNVIMLSVNMRNATMLGVILLSVVAPSQLLTSHFPTVSEF